MGYRKGLSVSDGHGAQEFEYGSRRSDVQISRGVGRRASKNGCAPAGQERAQRETGAAIETEGRRSDACRIDWRWNAKGRIRCSMRESDHRVLRLGLRH